MTQEGSKLVYIPEDWTSREMKRLSVNHFDEFQQRYKAKSQACRRQAFAGLPLETPIRSDQSAEVLLKLLTYVETEIVNSCHRYSWYKLLHMSRRIAPVRIGGITSWTTQLYRKVLTLAVLKHGHEPDREEYRKLNFHTTHDREPDLGITFEDLVAIYQIENLCLEYYMVTAALRRVWKRANLVVSPDLSWDSPAREDVEDMLDLLDRRKFEGGDPLSFFGTIVGNAALRHYDEVDPHLLVAFVPLLNTSRQVIEIDEPLAPRSLFSPNYLYVPYDLTSLASRLPDMRHLVESHYGFGPSYVISFLFALAQPHWLNYEGIDRLDKFYKMSQRAYQLVPRSAARKGYGRLLRAIHQEHFGKMSLDYAEHVAENLLKTFTVTNRSSIDLWVRRPHALATPILDKLLIDFSALPHVFGTLLENLANASDQIGQQKGSDFERAVKSIVTDHAGSGQLWLCSTKIHLPSGEREIDVSFVVSDTLIILECKGIGFSQALEKGERDQVEARWKQVKRYLEQADTLATALAESPSGKDYRLPEGVRSVLAVLCTPNPEYIPRRDWKYFLTDVTPRILTPRELSTLLSGPDFSWVHHPHKVSIQ